MTIWTSDISKAGTDSNVFLQIYGVDGKTEKNQLRNRSDNFERAQKDVFKVRFILVGYVLPSAGFKLTQLVHCSTDLLSLCQINRGLLNLYSVNCQNVYKFNSTLITVEEFVSLIIKFRQ